MRISELVAALEDLKAEHGDLPVFWMAYNEQDFDWKPAETVEFEAEGLFVDGPFVSVT